MRFLLGITSLCLLASCASTGSKKSANYLESVQIKFEQAEKAFENKYYDEALALYEEIQNKYPYSRFSALSDLRTADLFFAQSKWLEAADSYDFFLRFHPTHEKRAEAWFQMAQSYFNAIPKDFFLFPKSYVKDQTATQQALAAVNQFLAEFPQDQQAEKARKMRVKLRSQIAARDLHVAKYYLKRNHSNGAKSRLEHLINNYSDTPQAKEALAMLSKIK